MESTLGKSHARAGTRAPSGYVLPALGLLLFGLLTNLSSREEFYANLEYGFSLLAVLGAVGYLGHLAASIPRRSGALAFARSASVRVPPALVPSVVPRGTAGWPVLVALLFGPLVFLLSGLGGWV
ncbi:MAG: hypothetical protein M3151_15050 [Actinomycetota bacterium]|nr:hypothetical protein [Actinomycetota bacterium]